MADFRKLFLALIAGALLFTAVASAQPYSCNANAVPTLGRSEGIAEPTGDILLVCSGSAPATGILANIRYRLTVNITSDLEDEDDDITESLLVLDEGADAFRGPGSTLGTQNVYQALRISDDEIEWRGVFLAGSASNGLFKTIRLTNVRGNAQAAGSFGTLFATVNIVSPTSVPVNNPVLRVMDTRPGLEFSVTDRSFKNCLSPEDITVDPGDEADRDVILKFKEGFASSFKPQGPAASNGIPGGATQNESGFIPSLSTGSLRGTPGRADHGTRLMARFADVPDGVDLFVPSRVLSGDGMVLLLVEDPDSDGGGGDMTSETDLEANEEVGSDGLVVYEVDSIDANSYSTQETVEIRVKVEFDTPGPLTTPDVTVKGTFAPLSDDFEMSEDEYEPRFIDNAEADTDAFSINACRSILLFPFVTNQAGFDTGISIANTTADPLGTTAQAGTCTLNYYGNTGGSGPGPAAQTTPSVGAGGHFAMILSGGGSVFPKDAAPTACASGACVAPLFQGYIIAICNFQLAHGFAYVSDVQNDPSGRTLGAMGYLALIIPDRGDENRAPQDSSLEALENDGEGLAN